MTGDGRSPRSGDRMDPTLAPPPLPLLSIPGRGSLNGAFLTPREGGGSEDRGAGTCGDVCRVSEGRTDEQTTYSPRQPTDSKLKSRLGHEGGGTKMSAVRVTPGSQEGRAADGQPGGPRHGAAEVIPRGVQKVGCQTPWMPIRQRPRQLERREWPRRVSLIGQTVCAHPSTIHPTN